MDNGLSPSSGVRGHVTWKDERGVHRSGTAGACAGEGLHCSRSDPKHLHHLYHLLSGLMGVTRTVAPGLVLMHRSAPCELWV